MRDRPRGRLPFLVPSENEIALSPVSCLLPAECRFQNNEQFESYSIC